MSYETYRNKILKCTDAEFDFLGLQGLYFYIFLSGIGLAFILMLIMGTLDVSFIIRFGIPIGVLSLSYYVSKFLSNKYGRGGYSAIIENNVPKKIRIKVNKEVYDRLK